MLVIKNSNRNEIKEHAKSNGIAILPVGACEQHGPHLPAGTDVFLAESFSLELAKKIDAAVFPSIEYGYSWVWKNIPGTVTLEQETFKKILNEAVRSIERSGYKLIIIVNGHDSNKKAIKYVLRELDEEINSKILNFFYPGLNEFYKEYMESDTWYGMFHAEEFETSLMLYFKPELVNMDLAVEEYPKKPISYGYDSSSLEKISKSGTYGNAKIASAEKGRKIFEKILEYSLEIVNEELNKIQKD